MIDMTLFMGIASLACLIFDLVKWAIAIQALIIIISAIMLYSYNRRDNGNRRKKRE